MTSLYIVDGILEASHQTALEQQRRVAFDDGLALIVSDQARLSRIRHEPPLGLVTYLKERLRGPAVFGVSIQTPQLVRILSPALTANGLRQYYVDDCSMNWLAGVDKLRTFAMIRLLGGELSLGTLLRDLVSLRDSVMHRIEDRKLSPTKLSVDEERIRGLYNLQRRRVSTTDELDRQVIYEYNFVLPDWNAFCIALNDVLAAIAAILRIAISKGRIMCVEETRIGARLLNIDATLQAFDDRPSANSTHYFAATLDLSDEWFDKYAQGRKQLAIHQEGKALRALMSA